MSAFATGVTVITTARRGVPYGMTANAFSSLSLEPSLVLVCVGSNSRAHKLISSTGVFSANVLSSAQESVSRRFAGHGRPVGIDAFDEVPFTWGATRCPVIVGCVAHVDCRLVQMYPGGDHTIVIGEAVAMEASAELTPLIFYGGQYRGLSA
jgi:flavin reductase (DIM6/NTAB) family NADH-FMN oxidoreductase RutF